MYCIQQRIAAINHFIHYFVNTIISSNLRTTMQIRPAPILKDIIKHYLFLDSKGFEPKNLRFFSDGNTGIVFTTNNNLSLDHNKNKLPNSFLYGQITQFKDILLTNETALIIVVLHPTGIKKLLGIPAFELRDGIINLEDTLDKKILEIEEKLALSSTIEEKLNILNLFFTSIVIKNKIEKEQIVTSSINFILKNKGIVTNSQLTKFTGYSERHIERLFMDSIGLNPKQFSNIIKLNCFLRELKNKSNYTNLTEIAYNVGYADQSHLIKEFKKITGLTPTTYKNNSNKLAINFLALPMG